MYCTNLYLQAVKLYRSAASDFHPQSMFNLGLMYLNGTSQTPQDPEKGLELVTLAADFGLIEVKKAHTSEHRLCI